jgi:hypothetical protein
MLMDPARRAGLAADELDRLSGAVGDGLHQVYGAALVLALLALALAWVTPGGVGLLHARSESQDGS